MPVRIENAENSQFTSTHIISRRSDSHLMTVRRWFRDADDPNVRTNPFDSYTASWSVPGIRACLDELKVSRDVDWESISEYCAQKKTGDEYEDGLTLFYPPTVIHPAPVGWTEPAFDITGARLTCSDVMWELGKNYDPEDDRFFRRSNGILRVRSSVDLTAELAGLYYSTACAIPDRDTMDEIQYQLCTLLSTFPRVDRNFGYFRGQKVS